MQQATALFGPIVEVRDVLESFLHDAVLISGWRQILADASQQFIELAAGSADSELAALGRRIAVLAESDLGQDWPLTRGVAREIEALLGQVRVPHVPRPEDADWSF